MNLIKKYNKNENIINILNFSDMKMSSLFGYIHDEKVEDMIKTDLIKWFKSKQYKQTLSNEELTIEVEKYIESNSFSDIYCEIRLYLINNKFEIRQCSDCKKIMIQGYCIEGGEAYYCDDDCLYRNLTEEEFDELYDYGEGDSYWTEWN